MLLDPHPSIPCRKPRTRPGPEKLHSSHPDFLLTLPLVLNLTLQGSPLSAPPRRELPRKETGNCLCSPIQVPCCPFAVKLTSPMKQTIPTLICLASLIPGKWKGKNIPGRLEKLGQWDLALVHCLGQPPLEASSRLSEGSSEEFDLQESRFSRSADANF